MGMIGINRMKSTGQIDAGTAETKTAPIEL